MIPVQFSHSDVYLTLDVFSLSHPTTIMSGLYFKLLQTSVRLHRCDLFFPGRLSVRRWRFLCSVTVISFHSCECRFTSLTHLLALNFHLFGFATQMVNPLYGLSTCDLCNEFVYVIQVSPDQFPHKLVLLPPAS